MCPVIKLACLGIAELLTSSVTIKRIISLSSIRKTDHVVEIGAGKGHITEKLIREAVR